MVRCDSDGDDDGDDGDDDSDVDDVLKQDQGQVDVCGQRYK